MPYGQSTTLGAKGPVKLKNPWAEGPSILRTLFMQPFYTTCGASRAPFFRICGEAATTTRGAKGPVKLKNLPAHRAGQS